MKSRILLSFLLSILASGIFPFGNVSAFSTHDYFQNMGVTYELTTSDHTMINTAVAKIEAVIAKKWESFRSNIVLQLREYAMAKFNKNVRMSTIFGEVIASLKQTGKDKAVIKTATGTTVYAQAESLMVNGSKDLTNLSVSDIATIAGNKTVVKLLLKIEAKLQQDTLSACVAGNDASDQTLICSNKNALNYLKYLYLSSKNIANYSLLAENRDYATDSIISLEKAIKEITTDNLSGSSVFYGTYGPENKFYKMEILIWSSENKENGSYDNIIFYAHPDARQLSAQQ